MSGRETLKEARKADRIAKRLRELAEAVEQRADADRRIREAVAGLRRDRVSWRQLAVVLRTTPSNAHRKFRPHTGTPKSGVLPEPQFDL